MKVERIEEEAPMAEITAQAVNEFRKTTGLGLMECKALLKEADGDMKKALSLAKEKHGKNAENRAGRVTKAGRIEVYIHHDGKSGGMIEVNCETDFVARNEEFRQLAKDLALQVVAARPLCVRREEVPAEILAEQKQVKDESRTIREMVQEVNARTGENITISRFARFVVGEANPLTAS